MRDLRHAGAAMAAAVALALTTHGSWADAQAEKPLKDQYQAATPEQSGRLDPEDETASTPPPLENTDQPYRRSDATIRQDEKARVKTIREYRETTEIASLDQLADDHADLSTFVKAIDAAGLTSAFSSDEPYTLFAPTNDAFDALPNGELDRLMRPENQAELAELLRGHVVSGAVDSGSARRLTETEVLTGDAVTIQGKGDALTLGDATVVETDLRAGSLVIHTVDRVLGVVATDRVAATGRNDDEQEEAEE